MDTSALISGNAYRRKWIIPLIRGKFNWYKWVIPLLLVDNPTYVNGYFRSNKWKCLPA